MKKILKIRKAKLEDYIKISRLVKNTLKIVNSKKETKKDLNFELSQYTPKKIKKYIKTKQVFCLTNPEIIGVIIFDIKGRVLNSLFLNKDYIGRGFGQKMLKFIEKWAKSKKVNEILLYPTIYATNFYKKQGYRVKRRFKGTENKNKIITEWSKKLK